MVNEGYLQQGNGAGTMIMFDCNANMKMDRTSVRNLPSSL